MICFSLFVHMYFQLDFVCIYLYYYNIKMNQVFLYFNYKKKTTGIIFSILKKNHRYNLDSNIDLKIVIVSYLEIISAKLIIGLIFINIWLQRAFSLFKTQEKVSICVTSHDTVQESLTKVYYLLYNGVETRKTSPMHFPTHIYHNTVVQGQLQEWTEH